MIERDEHMGSPEKIGRNRLANLGGYGTILGLLYHESAHACDRTDHKRKYTDSNSRFASFWSYLNAGF